MRLIQDALAHPAERPALTHLDYDHGGEPRSTTLTFGELRRACEAFAPAVEPGQRVLLLHSIGPDFVVEFFGCLLGGAVPVPAPEPRTPRDRSADRLARIVADAGITAAGLTPQVSREEVVQLSPSLAEITWLGRGGGGAVPEESGARGEDLAYLQYTSGSTGSPRGIEITHDNVLGQARHFGDALEIERDSVLVNWAPFFHDMGLVLGLLIPLLRGARVVTLSPQAFIRDPERWLRAISDFGGTHSAAPDFAYDLCVRKVTEQQRSRLRLDTWKAAINGAEPVRVATMDRFATTFGPCGFRAEAMRPSYGLAECTLAVTTPRPGETPGRFTADRDALSAGSAKAAPAGRSLSSCGRPLPGLDVTILSPETGEVLPDGAVGEIAVAGWGVAKGFHGRSGDLRELRTGDLGFFHEGELYLTGRLKDVIIVRGQNYHPVDLEHVAQEVDPAIRPGGLAAFQDEGAVGLACEIRGAQSQESLADMATAIQRVISSAFQLKLDTITLVHLGSVPKTSSGKVQRNECRRRLAAGELRVRYQWRQRDAAPQPSVAMLRPMLRFMLAKILAVPADDLADDMPFAGLGLDSVGAEQLAAELERMLGAPVPTSLIFDHPTISDLAKALATP
ncbi:AMP-binding protein [Nonomuraea sp. NPDC050540]|uniref:AMP-binding protein n=1 Tax=Nonomuraea sp. NPDC050540 TaxID=3364367 RepID=UPI0037B907BB